MRVSRSISPVARQLFSKYPVLTLTGPRQSGKTTLCRELFPGLPYVNLERPDQREFAESDPRGFLRGVRDGAVLDEIQRVPELVSYLQEHVDEVRRNGMFVLTGSEQFRVSETISQSLAGRTALLRLLPFSIAEAGHLGPRLGTDEMIYTGFYPRIYDQGLDPTQALGDYFETYVERDVRRISEIRNLSAFRTFVRLCAGRTGQLLNLQSLGNDVGVSQPTARQWIRVLEASYIVFRLEPHHINISKRLVKSPKLYFYDVGLAAFLLGIENASQIATHPLRGSLFENLIVAEALKYRYNGARRSHWSFYRDHSGTEIDLLGTYGHRVLGIEIKAGATATSPYFAGVRRVDDVFAEPLGAKLLVHDGDREFTREGVGVTNPRGFAEKLAEVERGLGAAVDDLSAPGEDG